MSSTPVAWYNLNLKVQFPTSLAVGMSFASVEEVKSFLAEEAETRQIPYCPNMYNLRRTERMCAFLCKVCGGRIRLDRIQEDTDFVVSAVIKQHDHNKELLNRYLKKKAVRDEKCRGYHKKWLAKVEMEKREAKTKKSLPKPDGAADVTRPQATEVLLEEKLTLRTTKDIAKGGPTTSNLELSESLSPLKETEEPSEYSTPFFPPKVTSVLQWFTERWKCLTVTPNQTHTKSGKFRTLLLSTPTMIDNYSDHGQIVYLSLFPSLVHDEELGPTHTSWRFGLFSVPDANGRPLLAGVGLFQSETSSSMKELFKMFLADRKKPKSVLTDDSEPVVEAIRSLIQEQAFTGNHLLNPRELLRSSSKLFQGCQPTVNRCIIKLQQLIATRNKQTFSRIFKELQDEPVSKHTVKNLFENKRSIFYCGENAYFGIAEPHTAELTLKIDSRVREQTTLKEFVGSILQLEAELILNSEKFEEFDEQLPASYEFDNGLRDVVMHYQKNVVKRFLHNYEEALRNCSVGNRREDNQTYVLQVQTPNASYYISDGKCQCREFERTGVACPHLIAEAMTSASGAPYSRLIYSKWRTTQLI